MICVIELDLNASTFRKTKFLFVFMDFFFLYGVCLPHDVNVNGFLFFWVWEQQIPLHRADGVHLVLKFSKRVWLSFVHVVELALQKLREKVRAVRMLTPKQTTEIVNGWLCFHKFLDDYNHVSTWRTGIFFLLDCAR